MKTSVRDTISNSPKDLLAQYEKQIETIKREREEFAKKISMTAEEEKLKKIRKILQAI
ncbi:MAG: hypothetical protein WC858_05795 [Parcubacteria group bacterium]|jgi:hypothetical protein